MEFWVEYFLKFSFPSQYFLIGCCSPVWPLPLLVQLAPSHPMLGWEKGGGGEVTTPPLCNLTQTTLMLMILTGIDLHRWEPLHDSLITLRAVVWFCFWGNFWGNFCGFCWENFLDNFWGNNWDTIWCYFWYFRPFDPGTIFSVFSSSVCSVGVVTIAGFSTSV